MKLMSASSRSAKLVLTGVRRLLGLCLICLLRRELSDGQRGRCQSVKICQNLPKLCVLIAWLGGVSSQNAFVVGKDIKFFPQLFVLVI